MTAIAIFDLDNTIVHSRIDFAAIRRDVVDLLREHGAISQTLQELGYQSIGQIISIGEAHDAATGSHVAPQAWQIVLEYERQGMQAATVEDDAAPTLQQLRQQDWKLAVLTNNARPATLDALRKFELESYFDLILTRDEVPMKPDAGGIRRAMGHYNVKRTVMVGDAWLDGKAAHNAGVPFVAFGPVLEKMRQREIPVWQHVERLSELPKLLTAL
jgi:phosphoglycolate phosphatase